MMCSVHSSCCSLPAPITVPILWVPSMGQPHTFPHPWCPLPPGHPAALPTAALRKAKWSLRVSTSRRLRSSPSPCVCPDLSSCPSPAAPHGSPAAAARCCPARSAPADGRALMRAAAGGAGLRAAPFVPPCCPLPSVLYPHGSCPPPRAAVPVSDRSNPEPLQWHLCFAASVLSIPKTCAVIASLLIISLHIYFMVMLLLAPGITAIIGKHRTITALYLPPLNLAAASAYKFAL